VVPSDPEIPGLSLVSSSRVCLSPDRILPCLAESRRGILVEQGGRCYVSSAAAESALRGIGLEVPENLLALPAYRIEILPGSRGTAAFSGLTLPGRTTPSRLSIVRIGGDGTARSLVPANSPAELGREGRFAVAEGNRILGPEDPLRTDGSYTILLSLRDGGVCDLDPAWARWWRPASSGGRPRGRGRGVAAGISRETTAGERAGAGGLRGAPRPGAACRALPLLFLTRRRGGRTAVPLRGSPAGGRPRESSRGDRGG
jgi:hypothetical protein